MKTLKQIALPFLIALSALSVSASAAFYSITGLSKLFAGASFAVVIMASSLEIAKLVIASFLYQYWKEIAKLLRFYLTLALVILILITSAGIYGFLSSAYESTSAKNTVVEKQIAALEFKKANYTKTKDDYVKEKESTTKSTSELRAALSTGTMTQYKDPKTGQILNIANTGNRKAFERQLDNTTKEIEKLTLKIDVLNDSIFSLDNQILAAQSNAEVAGELGPLKYLSKLTGISMDRIINWFILIIIFVFDPLAISLVIAANLAFNKLKKPQPEKKLAIYNEKEEPKVEEPKFEPIIEEPKIEHPQSTPFFKLKKSIDNYYPPIFKRKRDDEDDTKTY